ncbi:zinc ribbon domain-containing protein [Butyrivibrio sp. AC2005]|uniref:zinc ribbon domain-containing protein n=1 Tax=Butyrivibrio sp. AC2005 TaxID=1280672 RepID=UPI00047D3894|nr:zinc-ribbon domain-containing protein [Butyrivibrio sp. AC2005]
MYCAKCGSEMENDAMFCPKCGAKVLQEGTGIKAQLSNSTKMVASNISGNKISISYLVLSILQIIIFILWFMPAIATNNYGYKDEISMGRAFMEVPVIGIIIILVQVATILGSLAKTVNKSINTKIIPILGIISNLFVFFGGSFVLSEGSRALQDSGYAGVATMDFTNAGAFLFFMALVMFIVWIANLVVGIIVSKKMKEYANA